METRGTIAQDRPQEEAGPQSGLVRLRIQTEAGRWVNVGPFNNLSGAKRLAEDLIADHAVHAVRVEHRQRSTWKPAWSWLAGMSLLLLVSLTGCATPGKVSTDICHSLSPAQRAEADVVEAALAKLQAQCLTEHPDWPCVLPKVFLVQWGLERARYNRVGHLIQIPVSMLRPERSYRTIMAHEIAHAWWPDARDHCVTEAQAVQCEYNANFHAIAVLEQGYGYSNHEAALMMWRLLSGMVRIKVKPSHGHPDACAELHDLEKRLTGITSPYACSELTATRTSR